jgi:hypothetical protein
MLKILRSVSMALDHRINMNRLQELLPAYVNGTANGQDRQYVKEALAQSAQARSALAWHEALAEKVIADVEAVPADIGWAQLQARVRAASQAKTMNHSQGAQSWWQQLTKTLESWMPHNWLPGPALSGVCALLLAVVGAQQLIGSSVDDREYSQVRGNTETQPLKPGVIAGYKYVKLNFKERISERDMRLLLIRTGAVLVGGPGQLGDYTVAVPATQIDSALKEFQSSMLTESIQEVAAPPLASDASSSAGLGAAPVQAGQK